MEPQNSGLVEIFVGDRGSGNRHYHNLASLSDLHYRGLSAADEGGVSVDELAQEIRSIAQDIAGPFSRNHVPGSPHVLS